MVALEIAQQLRRMGERVGFLCLLNTYVHRDLAKVAWIRYRYERAQRKIRELSTRQLVSYAAGKAVAAAGRINARARPVINPREALDLTITPAWETVYQRMCAATAAYRPQPYEGGPMVHVRTTVELRGEHIDPMPLWRQIARSGIVVVTVPGTHFEMVSVNAKAVAAALDQVLAMHAGD